jgi:hypothetical protein
MTGQRVGVNALQSTGRSLHINCLSEGGVQAATEAGYSPVYATLNMTVNFSAGLVQSDALNRGRRTKPEQWHSH